ncbi:RdgB/HAM1 family non-canonical purine NTP pyrophosphatase [Marinimicrobium sp. LS-A18]|uniref:RdgB/HAM1 family non-canonical purine NTP pyrophosphatase n=1 Tax=Marinimicrobium sp. LS-A18 TaxID=1381596 RepID=UPI0004668D3F|nr:RdgB/HAM1 family non-canonical purine NTP pyrophosphatase [Marinimicrobium sp. LS-A18]
MQKLVLASGNPGKLKEFQQLLADCGYQVLSQGEFGLDSAEETGLTFVENAILKARHASAQTRLPALADDSGLSVDALDGRPGIYSARYAGPEASDADNNARLLQELEGVPEAERGACYHCVLVLMRHAEDPTPVIAQGQWLGRIRTEPKGEGGFGYDPLFQVLERQCSAAELGKEEKGKISHRAIATRALLSSLSP